MVIALTSALIPNDYDERRKEYLLAIDSLGQWYQKAFVVECYNEGPPWICEKIPVIYTRVNNSSLRNKGVNEARALSAFLSGLHASNSEMIVKVTGRYRFENLSFLETCEQTDKDAIVCLGECNQVYTACFAMRKGIMEDMLLSIDYNAMESDMVNFERLVALYIERKSVRKEVVPKIGLVAPIFGYGKRDLQYL